MIMCLAQIGADLAELAEFCIPEVILRCSIKTTGSCFSVLPSLVA